MTEKDDLVRDFYGRLSDESLNDLRQGFTTDMAEAHDNLETALFCMGRIRLIDNILAQRKIEGGL